MSSNDNAENAEDDAGTYTVTREYTRSRTFGENDGESESFEPGDEIEPTEAELSAFPDMFEEVTARQFADADVPAAHNEDVSRDGDADEEQDEEVENDPGEADAPETTSAQAPSLDDVSADDLDDMDYAELRSLAGQVDGVSGRASADAIRENLRDYLEDGDSEDADDGDDSE